MISTTTSIAPPQAPDQPFNLFPNDPTPQKPELTTVGDRPKVQGTAFSVPAAPALRTGIDLARSLRPLMRKVPSNTRFELDEDATVTRIAETEVWMPVVQSRPERWLELDLVVEDSKTTVIWERAIAELNHLVEYQGAFRSVRTWRLSAGAGAVQLCPRWRDGIASGGRSTSSWRPHTPGELIDPTGRRLIWLVTDCTSGLWRQDLIYEVMLNWARAQPIAIVQMFPEEFWSRTRLRDGNIVRLSALAPGLPTGRLDIKGLPQRLERRARTEDLVTVPIVTLNAEALGRWSRVVRGVGDSQVPGRTFDREFIRRQMARSVDRSNQVAIDRTAEERVALFRSTASRTAQKLANLMAATAVSLPVIDLLRDAFRADFGAVVVEQSHVAEVLLSGLLRRCDEAEDTVCRYAFFGDDSSDPVDRVRDILLGDASIAKTMEVLNVLSAAIGRKLNSPVRSFEALLGELKAASGEMRDMALPFAQVGLDVLRRLGGDYAAIAERYEMDDRESTQIIDFPELQDCEYDSIAITAILDRVTFETATIARKKRLLRKETWEIQRQPSSAWGYTEMLPRSAPQPPILGEQEKNPKPPELGVGGGSSESLEMIAIPSGTFTMGAPKDESGAGDDEKPQHEVTVQSFYMGQHQVTQAQWRVVAGYEQIDRTLKPDPSNFKGDRLPVENVDWDDAQEFCKRLSAQTGKAYRLPTEAEWEYACRAGTETPFHFGETLSPELANYDGTCVYNDGPKGEYREKTIEVGSLSANAWGLYDMHGNVWEWCEDDWHSSYKNAPTDGSAWVESDRESSRRLLRGGSWDYIPVYCRSANRHDYTRDFRSFYVGFRVSCGFGVVSSR